MTIDEAIHFYEEVSNHNLMSAKKYGRDKNDRMADALEYDSSHNKQLAQWLKELKAYRETIEEIRAEQKDVYMDGYNEGYEDAKELYS